VKRRPRTSEASALTNITKEIMETIQLDAQTRDTNVSPSLLRRTRIIPAVFYGKSQKSLPLQMPYGIFRKVYLKAGGNHIIELHIDGKKKETVLVHDVQFYPLTGEISHVDFLAVSLSEEVTTHVPVEITGVSLAVKDMGGILTTVKHEIEVKCLPMDIPQSIPVDISVLADFTCSVHVKDLNIPAKVKVLDNPEDVVVTVSAPREEEVVAAPSGLEGTAAEAAAKEEAAAAADAPEAGEGTEKS
jgi:large subunit ribosomal protein L25